jgi:hypothetical protein
MRKSTEEKKEQLLEAFSKLNTSTTNQAINYIYNKDLTLGIKHMVTRGWKYYVHLNKLTVMLEKDNLIHQVDTIIGPTGMKEKVWSAHTKRINK